VSEGIGYFVGDPACFQGFFPDIFTEVCGMKDGAVFGCDEPYISCPCCQYVEPLSDCPSDRDLPDPVAGFWGCLFPSSYDGVLYLDVIGVYVAFEQTGNFGVDHPG